MAKSHFVVFLNQNSDTELFPMKQWLRENPDQIPQGMDASHHTSYQLRRALRKSGWEMEELEDRVLLIRPENGDTSYADNILNDFSESGGASSSDEAEDIAEIKFSLERDLQSALRANIEQLESGLSIVDGGKETTTEAGRIDITAKDPSGQTVVIELKAGTASPATIAQVLAYMGGFADQSTTGVRGLLIASDFHPRVILAARAVPNLQLKRYAFQFSFHGVN